MASFSCWWKVRLLLVLILVQCLSVNSGADLYVCPGDPVTLPCDGGTDKDINEVEVSWMFGSVTICSFKNGISICEHRDFVNRAQLGSIQENNFSLVINDVKVQDCGGYKCLISGAVMQRNRLFVDESRVCKPYKDKEFPDENPPGTPSNRHSIDWTAPIAVTAGIVLIAVIAVIAVIAITLPIKWNQLWIRLMNRQRNEVQANPTPSPEKIPLNNEVVLNESDV